MEKIQNLARVLDKWPAPRAFALVTLVWGVLYFISNHVNFFGIVPQTLFTSVDKAMPFVDWTIIIYWSVFVQLPVGMWWLMQRQRGAIVIIGSLITVVHFIIFIIYPTILPRTGCVPTNQLWIWVYNLQWASDSPVNCFPSLHIGAVALLSLCVWRENKKIGIIFSVWSLAVAASTLTTKQHYIVDLLGGCMTAAVIYYFLYRKIRRPHG